MASKKYGWDCKMPYGKYKGKTIREVFESDPYYLLWCWNNISGFIPKDEILIKLLELPLNL